MRLDSSSSILFLDFYFFLFFGSTGRWRRVGENGTLSNMMMARSNILVLADAEEKVVVMQGTCMVALSTASRRSSISLFSTSINRRRIAWSDRTITLYGHHLQFRLLGGIEYRDHSRATLPETSQCLVVASSPQPLTQDEERWRNVDEKGCSRENWAIYDLRGSKVDGEALHSGGSDVNFDEKHCIIKIVGSDEHAFTLQMKAETPSDARAWIFVLKAVSQGERPSPPPRTGRMAAEDVLLVPI